MLVAFEGLVQRLLLAVLQHRDPAGAAGREEERSGSGWRDESENDDRGRGDVRSESSRGEKLGLKKDKK